MESQDKRSTTVELPLPPPERFSEDALPAGTVLADRYRISAYIGQGGFGIAYLARRTDDAQRVVIKEYLPRELARRSRSNAGVVVGQSQHREIYVHGLESFLNEARLLQQFDEPSIVRVLEIFQENETAYLVMPYEEGKTLAELVKAGQRFEEGELRTIFLQLLDGLRVIHARGYLHRDIKPSNIIIRNSDLRPILIDFGAARQALVERSRSISSMLTPGYAPFEQYPGHSQRQGRWSDLYSVGVTLYQAVTLCSEDTLEQGNANVRLEALHTGRPDPLAPAVLAGSDFCTQELLSIIDWMMQPRIEDRPQTVEAVQDCLLGKASAPPVPPRHTAQQPPAWSTATTLIAPPREKAASPRRNGGLAALGGIAAVVGAIAVGVWLLAEPAHKVPLPPQVADEGIASSDQLSQATALEGIQQSAPPAASAAQATPNTQGGTPLADASDHSADNPVESSPADRSGNSGGDAVGNSGEDASQKAGDNPGPLTGPPTAYPSTAPGRHYRLTVNTVPANARVELINSGQPYHPGMPLPPKRYRLRITAPHYQPFVASLALKGDVQASVKLCPFVTRSDYPVPPGAVARTLPPNLAGGPVQNIADRINIPTATGGGELVRRTEAMLCTRAQNDLRARLTTRCQNLGGQGAPLVSNCAYQPVSVYVRGRYVVTQSYGVTGTVACAVSRPAAVPQAVPAPPPLARTVVDPNCPAPALSY